MASHSPIEENTFSLPDNATYSIDYGWFMSQFNALQHRIENLESTISHLDGRLSEHPAPVSGPPQREYYSTQEFAELVDRSEYTVREWCRLERINAEKCDSGRGDAKSWKIPADELQRFQDHGLLPLRYFR